MSDPNTQVVQQIYAAFSRGDVPAIMEHISDDLRHFGVVSEKELLPWHVQAANKHEVPRFFEALAESSEFTRFEPADYASGGDHVYCTISFDVRFKKNGNKITHNNVVHRFTFKNGKVVEWLGTEDTAKVSAAYNA
jgi:ketosteroid isomerase-like protein